MARKLAALLLILVATPVCWAQDDLNAGDARSHISGGCPTFSCHDQMDAHLGNAY
jgi:hypothetical protein